jgi:hypothetical protein
MKLGVFKAVGTTYSLGLRHFPAFYLLCLLAGLPSVIYAALSGQGNIGQYLAMQGWERDLTTAVEILLTGFVTAAMVWTLIRDRQGESRTIFAALRDTLERSASIISVGVVFAVVTTVLTTTMDVLAEVAPLAVFIPMLIAFVLSVIFAVAMPCAAMDNDGVVDCFGSSAALTKGSRLRIIAVFFLITIPLVIAVAVFLLVVQPAAAGFDGLPIAWLFLGAPAMNLFLMTGTVAIHEQLAELDDGVMLRETAAVFD